MTAAVTTAAPVAPSRMRRAVIRSVTASAAVPQYSVELDVDLTAVLQLRRRLRADLPRVSVTDLLHRAVAATLPEHPLLNSAFTDDGVVTHAEVNLAFIVEVGDGMLTPTIRGADRLDLAALADERVRLTAAAGAGRLTGEELLSGTFTVSNLGPLGVHRFRAMLLPPQAAILAVGAAGDDRRLTLTLTCDHRVVDGAPAARFLAALGRRLTEPAALAQPSPSTPPTEVGES
jgi:pyruvate dehydrogenase E2 component (dihydrolipoamide acetyltransferase)